MPNLKFPKFSLVPALFLLIMFSINTFGQNTPTSKCGEEDYDAQITEATKGIKFSSYNIEAYIARGIAYLNKTEYDKALKDFNRALEINPRSDKALSYRGEIYFHRGNYDKAILDLNIVIELNPQDAYAYFTLARSYGFKNEKELAIEGFSKAIALKPEMNSAYYNRGREYYNSGNKEAAKKDFKKAFEIVSGKIELIPKECRGYTYLSRGIIAYALGDSRQALTDYNNAINLEEFSDVYFHRGSLHLKNNDYKEAIADYTKSIELDPQWALVYKRRSQAYEKIKELDKAEADRKKYEELSNQP